MKSLLKLESPLMSFLTRLADLMILNLLMLICCIPIITIGASLTAMYYVVLRLHNDECNSVTRDFFHAFKGNFRQATVIWIIYLVEILALVEDYYLMFGEGIHTLVRLRYVTYLFTALLLVGFSWSFVLLSRYTNSIGRTILNSYLVGITNLPRTIIMILPMLVAMVLLRCYPAAAPLMILIGLSLTGYLQMFLFRSVFEKLEHLDVGTVSSKSE